MKKIIIWILVLISALFLVVRFAANPAVVFLGIKEKSGIRILSLPENAIVKIDNKEVGKTPYENDDLVNQDYELRIEKEGAFWQGKVRLAPGTLTVVNRELSKDGTSSAGEILTLEKGKGATFISNPSDAQIEIDGKYYGKTPLSVDIPTGEHTFALSRNNYLKRSIRANLPGDYNLVITVDLALSEVDLATPSTPATTTTPMVTVKETPTGFLRVRDKGSLLGKEIAKVKPGDELILLEEGSWDRVRLSDGTEGFVSSAYVDKKEETQIPR